MLLVQIKIMSEENELRNKSGLGNLVKSVAQGTTAAATAVIGVGVTYKYARIIIDSANSQDLDSVGVLVHSFMGVFSAMPGIVGGLASLYLLSRAKTNFRQYVSSRNPVEYESQQTTI